MTASHTPPASSDENYTRLHITPFDADLLKVVLPTSIAHVARNVSFHTIETFPEKRYGFVDLPHMEAEKLKKKLNGATLKGTKIRIEKARPEEREQADEATPDVKKSKSNKSEEDGSKERRKKRKREVDVLEGVKLKDRKVKRGWTETPEEASKKTKRSKGSKDKDKTKSKEDDKKSQRKRIKSKYTDEAECLLNTKIPPNAVKNLTASESASKRRKKDKSRQVTIHEFEKTTKFPSFLKNTASDDNATAAAEFVEGKGWVDTEGNVVEQVKTRPRPAKKEKTKASGDTHAKPTESHATTSSEDSDDTSSSGSSSEDDDDSSETSDVASPQPVSSPMAVEQSTPNALNNSEKSRPMSSSSSRSLTIKIPPPITPSNTKVHPLEALYKRTKPDGATAEIPAQAQPFSFFGGGEDEEGEEEAPSSQPAMPMTPFTRQDLEWRNVRSAAPTPDTAHPSRVRNFWAAENEEKSITLDGLAEDDADDRDEEDDDEPVEPAAGAQRKSEFQDWFWENRRDLNRSWMKRRKASAKEKRHRDNKARASRVF